MWGHAGTQETNGCQVCQDVVSQDFRSGLLARCVCGKTALKLRPGAIRARQPETREGQRRVFQVSKRINPYLVSQCFLFLKFHHDDVDLYIYMWYCDRLMMDACILHTYGVRRMVWMKGKGLEPNNKNNNKNNRKLADISPGICQEWTSFSLYWRF